MTAEPAPPALRLRSVAKLFPAGFLGLARRAVLADVDLDVAPGERLGLIGPNGAGKSTLLRIAAGVELPSRGSVRAHGADPRSAAGRRGTGFVPDGAPFPRELDARACLELAAALQGLRGRALRDACSRALEQAGLARARGRLGSFSLGMLRRFALAQAFVHEPRLVLLDEPTAGLDAEGHGLLEELLGRARARGAAVVLCSHHLEDVARFTDGVRVVAGGRLAADARLAPGAAGARLDVEGLDEAALRELEDWVRARGGRVVGRAPSGAAVARLYAELAREGA